MSVEKSVSPVAEPVGISRARGIAAFIEVSPAPLPLKAEMEIYNGMEEVLARLAAEIRAESLIQRKLSRDGSLSAGALTPQWGFAATHDFMTVLSLAALRNRWEGGARPRFCSLQDVRDELNDALPGRLPRRFEWNCGCEGPSVGFPGCRNDHHFCRRVCLSIISWHQQQEARRRGNRFQRWLRRRRGQTLRLECFGADRRQALADDLTTAIRILVNRGVGHANVWH